MSYCLNPKCPNPSDLSNNQRETCRHCGSELILKGRYRLVRPLGGGGFGKTFEVNDRGTIKVLKILYKNHPKAVELFQQEAVVLSRLQHPGIPKVEPEGYFTFLPHNFKEPLHCLVMEKISGSNLEEWFKERDNKPLQEEEAIAYLKQLVEILDKVHQQQFFHRDIKPLNIMRKADGQLVLIDFGAAREVTSTYLAKVGQGQNVTGIVSPGYTPPEQVNGKAVPQSDFYAIGRTFVYLLTGQPPTAFPENPRTGKLVWRESAPQVSPEFADVMDYLMAPFPGNRPQNAQMILQCLAEVDDKDATTGFGSGFAKRRNSGSGNTAGRVANSRNSATKRKDSLKTRLAKEVRRDKYKKLLLTSGALLLLGLGATQAYSYWRFGEFPANPLLTIASLPSSRFLEKSINAKGQVGSVNAIASIPVVIPSKPKPQQIFASASYGTVRLWDIATGKLLHVFGGHSSGVRAIAIDEDGQIMASGSDDKSIRLWNLQGRNRMLTINPAHADAVISLAISPDGDLLASGSRDKTIRLWLLPSGQRILTLTSHAGPVNALAISPDGKFLVSGSDDKTVKIWNLNAGRLVRTLFDHKGSVQSLAISPDGQTLASGSSDSTVMLWQLSTGKLLNTLKGDDGSVRALTFSPNGKILASGADNIKLWDLKSAKDKRSPSSPLQTFIGHSQFISALAISPDGKTLISGSPDRSLKIWWLP